MNKVILIGRITKDPELKKTPTDVSVVQFTIAVNRNYQDKNGERQADFISCVAWRNQADNLARFIKKGALLAVEGNLQTRQYDDQSGQRRYVTEVVCDNVTFLETKKDNNNGGFGDLSQLTPPSYQSNNYGNNSFNNGYNNNKQVEKNPFDEIDKQFDISSDDLPF